MNNVTLNSEFDNDDEIELMDTIPPRDLFAFNELRSCADLNRMYDKGQLDLSPAFQREQVWGLSAQTRFLDSLLKNLPIPSMCISQDTETHKRIVIDGLQRISTIVSFLQACNTNQKDFKLSVLDDVDPRLSGKKVSEILENTPELIEIIENVTIPITVLRSTFSKVDHMEYIFTIFHRLNTGGTRLNAQEIRNCIFSGNFNTLLFECAKEFHDEIHSLIGVKNNRFTYEEFVLRFFAFYDRVDEYKAPLTRFLNLYMKDNRVLSDKQYEEKKELFSNVLILFRENIKHNIIRKKVVAEAILYGLSVNLKTLENKEQSFFDNAFKKLMESESLKDSELQSGTSDTTKVKQRLKQAKIVFSG